MIVSRQMELLCTAVFSILSTEIGIYRFRYTSRQWEKNVLYASHVMSNKKS